MDGVVARMIETPSPERMHMFFSALAAAGIGPGLEVRHVGDNKGKGLIASKTFEEGDVVLIEPPLVAAQDTANKVDALVCAHCFRYVGSLELQIGRRLPLNQTQTNGGGAADTPFIEKVELEPSKREVGRAENFEVKPGRMAETRSSELESEVTECTNQEKEERGSSQPKGEETECTDLEDEETGPSELDFETEGGYCCEDESSEDDRISAPPETVAALLEGSLKLPLSEQFPLPAAVECLGGCSENVYCSAWCAGISWEAHHKLLCTGPRSEAADSSALRDFKEFADGSNNIFHVAAQVIAATVLRVKEGGGPIVPEHLLWGEKSGPERGGVEEKREGGAFEHQSTGSNPEGRSETEGVRKEGSEDTEAASVSDERSDANGNETRERSETGSKPQSSPVETTLKDAETAYSSGRHGSLDDPLSGKSEAFLKAWEPFSMGWKAVWWESVACPSDMVGRPQEEAAFRTSMKDLCDGSLKLLRKAFGREAEALRPLFSLEVYSRIIGMFELNNLALVVQSPVENYFLAIDELPEEETRKVEPVTKPLLDALGRSYSAHCEGTAFYTLQSCANHSCEPNARAFKREEDVDGRAVLLANRRIEAGEEVTISYIDETDVYEARQNALEDYGFVCCCSRCQKDVI